MITLLLIVTALTILAAIIRRRPATAILGANVALVLRGIQSFREYGKPASQEFLPDIVFRAEAISIAERIFAIVTALLAISILLPSKRPPKEPVRFDPLPWPVLLGVGIYFALNILSTKTILQGSYSDESRFLFGFNLSGAHPLIVSLLLYEMYRRVRCGLLSPMRAFLWVFILSCAGDYIKGTTGMATGVLVTAIVMLLGEGKPLGARTLRIVGALTVVMLIALTVRGVRGDVHEGGLGTVTDFLQTIARAEGERSTAGEGVESFGNGIQSAAHVLECVNLYEAGVSREWHSIYAPLEYTVKPSFLLKMLGWTRSKEAAWELADYYVHGGGINTFGEFYWNGGYLCVVICSILMLGWAYLCDTRFRYGQWWLLLLCNFSVGLLQGIGYGFAQVSRGFFNGLLSLAFVAIVVRLRSRRRRQPWPSARATPVHPDTLPAGVVRTTIR